MFDAYIVLIGGSVLVALSYVFDVLSKKWRIPSVLFLIGTGMAMKVIINYYEYDLNESFFNLLELLGIIGLIMIVLEAAVDLKIGRDKQKIIKQSIFMALIILVVSSLAIAVAIMFFRSEPFFNALVYAIPLSVVSSAVLIPSVHTLTQRKKEFMIYEATFSDIIGIMFFNFVVMQSGNVFSYEGLLMILATIVFSFLLSYTMVYFFSKIKTHIKLFLMLAILALLYSIGKKLNLSSLLIIFIFGLVLNNSKQFFRWKLKNYIDFKSVRTITKDFRIITAETAFVVRTFFFVAFGMSINIGELMDPNVLLVGSIIVVILYVIRYVNFKVFLKTDVLPEIFLAPRGLITILLFFSIPLQYQIHDFSIGILSFVILATSIIMMIALLATPSLKTDDMMIVDYGLAPAAHNKHDPLEDVEPSGPYCELENFKTKVKNKYISDS